MSDVVERNRAIAYVATRLSRVRTWAETGLAAVHQAQRAIGELPVDLDADALRELDQASRRAELALDKVLSAEWLARRKFMARFPVKQD